MLDTAPPPADLEPGAVITHAPGAPRWPVVERIAFRFAFAYLILYCWPESGRSSLLQAIPIGTELLTKWAQAPWHALCPWVAIHIFHLSGPVTRYHPTGSGDTTLDYVQVFCFAVIAMFAVIVWSILDRYRPQYRTLYAWLRLVVRFTLAFTLLLYGFAKVYPLQFLPPFLTKLTEPYGEASPMGLLWTFMGASTAYTLFTGLVEVMGGLLLLFRRTTTLGALIGAGALLNIVMLNFCYDVPVKLYSVHLLVMALFLLLPDVRALWNFFFLHRPSGLEGVWLPRFERRWLRGTARVLQILVVLSVLYSNIWGGYKMSKQYRGGLLKHAPLYGIWEVDNVTSGGPSPAAVPDSSRWRRMIVDTARSLVIRTGTGKAISFQTKYDAANHKLTLTAGPTKQSADLTYSHPDDQHLVLRGTLDHNPVAIQLHRYNASQFLLTSRGFHWISEYPFNR